MPSPPFPPRISLSACHLQERTLNALYGAPIPFDELWGCEWNVVALAKLATKAFKQGEGEGYCLVLEGTLQSITRRV